MLDLLSRVFVELGYIALAVNGVIILRKCPCSWYQRWAMFTIIPIALSWTFFYTAVNFHWFDPATYPPLSRLFHTVTIGNLAVQQFLVQKAAGQELASLQGLLLRSLRPGDD